MGRDQLSTDSFGGAASMRHAEPICSLSPRVLGKLGAKVGRFCCATARPGACSRQLSGLPCHGQHVHPHHPHGKPCNVNLAFPVPSSSTELHTDSGHIPVQSQALPKPWGWGSRVQGSRVARAHQEALWQRQQRPQPQLPRLLQEPLSQLGQHHHSVTIHSLTLLTALSPPVPHCPYHCPSPRWGPGHLICRCACRDVLGTGCGSCGSCGAPGGQVSACDGPKGRDHPGEGNPGRAPWGGCGVPNCVG